MLQANQPALQSLDSGWQACSQFSDQPVGFCKSRGVVCVELSNAACPILLPRLLDRMPALLEGFEGTTVVFPSSSWITSLNIVRCVPA